MDKKYISHHREPFYQIAKDLILPNSIVLDVGAGHGSFSRFCERNDFYMLDSNPENATLKTEFCHYVIAALPKLPYEDRFFDLIHCSHVIEHLEPTCFYDTLKEMDRCLKDGGHLVISTPLMSDFFYDNLSHIKPYNPVIFSNYLCTSYKQNLNRKQISSAYKVEKLIYRYKAYKIFEEHVFLPINWISSIAFKMGLRRYAKTGYTIVLKKDTSKVKTF